MEPRRGFDFTHHIARVCEDMVSRVEALRHIDMRRVAVSFCQTRKNSRYGMFASLTPLRFAGGAEHTIRRGRRWGVQRVVGPDGGEMLYILNFYLPRFLSLSLREKFDTTMHELWHVGPRFDGDVRRLGGRCFAHGASQKAYDAQVARLVDVWLAAGPAPEIYQFLHCDLDELIRRHGRVVGRKIRAPKLVPLE